MTEQEKRRKAYKLGDKWKCECGEAHTLDGVYLAAHWYESLVHTCEKCGRQHRIQGGVVELAKQP